MSPAEILSYILISLPSLVVEKSIKNQVLKKSDDIHSVQQTLPH
jgi:hypothetical protein